MKKDISVIIPTINEEENIGSLIDKIRKLLKTHDIDYEIIVVDGGSKDNTVLIANQHGALTLRQKGFGYGAAFKEGVSLACGDFIITMDADLSHSPEYIIKMWDMRKKVDMVIASRYIQGGKADMPFLRLVLSILLNKIFSSVLSLPFKDISSGFRMYKTDILKNIRLDTSSFDILEEILIKLHLEAFVILEIPFYYRPRKKGSSHVRPLRLAFTYLKTLFSMWQLRNSIFSADYDARAYNSKIPLQRYWQRKRFSIIKNFIGSTEDNILDIGCGSSKIIRSLPKAIGFDIKLKILKYLKMTNTKLVQGAIQNPCFKNNSFDLIIISEVIEHIPKEDFKLKPITNLLRKNGILIIGTPDYTSFIWRVVEYFYKKLLPHAHGESHVSCYTFDELKRLLNACRLSILAYKYICASEVIIKVQKI